LNQLEKDSEAMRNRDIIITSLQPFYLPIGSNCINIAEELSKQNRVLYVNYAFDRSSIKREKDKPHLKIRHEMKVGLKPNKLATFYIFISLI
jgi:hypothetical protein